MHIFNTIPFLNNQRLSCSGKWNFLKRLTKVFSFQFLQTCSLFSFVSFFLFCGRQREQNAVKCLTQEAWGLCLFSGKGLSSLPISHMGLAGWPDSINYSEATDGKVFPRNNDFSFHIHLRSKPFFSRGQLPFQAFISTAARQAWGPPQTWLICPFQPSPVESARSNHSPHFHLTDSYSSLQQILCWEHDPIIKEKEVKT